MIAKNILAMGKEEILQLGIADVCCPIQSSEFFHIAKVLGASWMYDYDAQKQGRPGLHAELKSLQHSDGFFVSKILLEPDNICDIMAFQMVARLEQYRAIDPKPDYVAAIPDGATKLGKRIAGILDAKEVKMEKRDGRIELISEIPENATALPIEDFCTRGTGLIEAMEAIRMKNPGVKLLPYNPVILNRGGLGWVGNAELGKFLVIAIVNRRINDWKPEECPLCKMGSKPIKPKATDENWQQLIASQLS